MLEQKDVGQHPHLRGERLNGLCDVSIVELKVIIVGIVQNDQEIKIIGGLGEVVI